MNETKKIFIESPFKIGIYTSLFMAFILAFLLGLFAIFYDEVPSSSKLAKLGIKSISQTIGFITLIYSILMAILWGVLIFTKKQIIICDQQGCQIVSKSYWDFEAKETSFDWKDVTGVEVKTGYRGIKSLFVLLKNEEYRLMDQNLFNRREFNDLENLIRTSTSDLLN